jgi:hypothetical protein
MSGDPAITRKWALLAALLGACCFVACFRFEEQRQLLAAVMRGVNNVQAALDICFDVWISAGTVLLAAALVSRPFRMWFGLSGITAAALALNLATYSPAPASPGVTRAQRPYPGNRRAVDRFRASESF